MSDFPITATRSARTLDPSPTSLIISNRRVSFSAAAPSTVVLLAPDSNDVPNGVEIISEVGIKNETVASKYTATARETGTSLFSCHNSPMTASMEFEAALLRVSNTACRTPDRTPRKETSRASSSKKSMRNMTANDLVRIRRLKSQDFTSLRKTRRREFLLKNQPSQPDAMPRSDRSRRASVSAIDDLGPALAIMFSPSLDSTDSDDTIELPTARPWRLRNDERSDFRSDTGRRTPSPNRLADNDTRRSWPGSSSSSDRLRPAAPVSPASPRASPLRSLSESMTVVIGKARTPEPDDDLASLEEKLEQIIFPSSPLRSPSAVSLASSASSQSSQASTSPRRLQSDLSTGSNSSTSSLSRLPPVQQRRSSLDASASWHKFQESSLRRSSSKPKDSFGEVIAQVKKAMDHGKPLLAIPTAAQSAHASH
eukprot:TRINITY_DN5798_c0_g1_i1.p1 TRINITY_DN5798_c0_g1~~TRINITY_DN5798_c0_g1_i1.p1  ORF type:complete len:426 (-),score=59.10 TRINITY_DN5798_c0_g1_i1:101-1378(-)